LFLAPMRIPLLYVKDNVRDWILVELQGSFHLNEDSTAQNLQRIEEKVYLGGINIGEMSVNWEEETAKLKVGNSLLQGKVIPLKKPVGVLKKQPDGNSENGVCIQWLGVARKRILFNTRPQLLVK